MTFRIVNISETKRGRRGKAPVLRLRPNSLLSFREKRVWAEATKKALAFYQNSTLKNKKRKKMNEMNLARSMYYEFLSFPLFWDENEEGFYKFVQQSEVLSENLIYPENEKDFKKLSRFEWSKFKKEQNGVLFDLSFVNVPQTASFYDEGRDDGKKRSEVIEILKSGEIGVEANLSEDYIGLIFTYMSRFLREGKEELARRLFDEIINGFVDEFCELLAEHDRSNFFKAYANLLMSFVELERAFLGVEKPAPKAVSQARNALAKKPYETKVKSSTRRTKVFEEEMTKLSE